MNAWRRTTWGDAISLEYGKSLRGYSDVKGPVRVFGSNGPVGWTSEALAPGPGIILGRKGAYRGVHYSPSPFFVIDTAYYVVPKTDFDMRWLYYAIIYYRLGEIDDGSPVPSTTRAAVYVRDVEVPPLQEQRSIAAVLGALDDKVDLNHRLNETLRAMASAIFKDWFVDFGPTRAKAAGERAYLAPRIWALFPSAVENMKASGWTVSTLGKLTTKIGSGATPRGGKEVYVDEGTNFIRSQNVYDHQFVWDGLAKINADDAERLRGVSVLNDDILINITGDSILRTCVVDPTVLPARVNQHVAIVRAGKGVPSRYLHHYMALPSTKAHLLGNDAGGSRAAVTKGHLEMLPVPLPPSQILRAFEELTEPWFALISCNEAENQILAEQRNLLLPKLMSGEIRLRDAEQLVNQVA